MDTVGRLAGEIRGAGLHWDGIGAACSHCVLVGSGRVARLAVGCLGPQLRGTTWESHSGGEPEAVSPLSGAVQGGRTRPCMP